MIKFKASIAVNIKKVFCNENYSKTCSKYRSKNKCCNAAFAETANQRNLLSCCKFETRVGIRGAAD